MEDHSNNEICKDDFIDLNAGINISEFVRLYTCPLCCNIMKIPTKVLWPCCTTKKDNGCRAIACLRCVRNLLGLNGGPRKNINDIKCFVCRTSTFKFDTLGAHCYSKETLLMAILDCLVNKKFICDGNYNNKWCNKEFGSQFDLERHIKGKGTDPCMYAYIFCPYNEYGCRKMLMRCELKDHEKVCNFALYRCAICDNLIKMNDVKDHLFRHLNTIDKEKNNLIEIREKVESLLNVID